MSGTLAERLRLMVITDPDAGGRDVAEVVRAALRGGATAVQVRLKGGTAREMVELAGRVRPDAQAAGALLLVNDRVDVAIAAGADGAHLGDDDLPVHAARRIAPPGFVLGASADSVDSAQRAARDGADYLGVGPVYPTGSKPDAGDAVGVERIRDVAAAVAIPVVGIGGISVGRVHAVVAAGAAGVAVIAAVMRAADPEAVARALLGEERGG